MKKNAITFELIPVISFILYGFMILLNKNTVFTASISRISMMLSLCGTAVYLYCNEYTDKIANIIGVMDVVVTNCMVYIIIFSLMGR